MASAWVYQDDKQVKKHGEAKASWYVGWLDPEGKRKGKSCGPGPDGLRNAEKLRRKVEAQLLTGTYQGECKALWQDLRRDWEREIGPGLAGDTLRLTLDALNHFERLARPSRTYFVTTRHVDHYVTQRRQERGQRPGSLVSAATINKELRHLRAVLRVGKEWGYLPEVPRCRFVKEERRLPTYMTGDHFAAVYAACDKARLPRGLSYPAADWWRALMVMGY